MIRAAANNVRELHVTVWLLKSHPWEVAERLFVCTPVMAVGYSWVITGVARDKRLARAG